MDSNNNVKKENDSKKITFVLVAILVIMVTTTGGTYAYLQLSANSAATAINGTVATASLTFSAAPSLVAPTSTYATKGLVPQYAYNNSTNVLQLAVTGVHPTGTSGTTVYPCVDSNGNAVCRVYSFTVKNNSTATVVINGTITFSTLPNTLTNLKWAPMSNATTTASITSATDSDIHAASSSPVALTDAAATPATTWTLAAGATKPFWLVFWVNETGVVQTDSGSWNATIAFNSSNGTGVTSTITGA